MNTSSLLAFGPPKGLLAKPEAKELLIKIINDGNFLHSCLDYQGTLQFTRNIAFENNLATRLICKIYLNYPSRLSIRRGSLCEQISKIRQLFAGTKVEIVPQISSIYNVPFGGYKEFVRKAYYDFNIKQILIEIFPDTESKCFDFLERMQDATMSLGLENKFSFALTSYDSPTTQGFTTRTLEKARELDIKLAPMRILGSPTCDKDVAIAIKRLREIHTSNHLFRGITRVSSLDHYKTLESIIRHEFNGQIQYDKHDIAGIGISKSTRPFALDPYGLSKKRNKLLVLRAYTKDLLVILMICIREKSLLPIRKLLPTNLI